MTSRQFNLSVSLQLILITLNNFIIVWSLFQEHLQFTSYYFIIVLIIQLWYLFSFIKKKDQKIVSFLRNLKFGDNYNYLPKDHSEYKNSELKNLLDEMAESYNEVKIEKESEHQYFLNTIRHVNIGLISFNDKGKVELMNKAAEKLLLIDNIIKIQSLFDKYPRLKNKLDEAFSGKSTLWKLVRENDTLQISIRATSFSIKEKKIMLVSLQDIKSELQQEEINVWQRLIRVLTHEIMNSVSPITSLSTTLIDTFKEEIDPDPTGINKQTIDSILLGLQAIEKRSKGLSRFVETYRSLTKIPKPCFSEVNVVELFNHIEVLMKDEVDNVKMKFKLESDDLIIVADEKLITQVLINLIRNALQSLKKSRNGLIRIAAFRNNTESVVFEIEDNGQGILPEIRDKIFIPFFTTKKDGSGVGLSLSRQIMSLHDGNIDIRSMTKKGTTAILTFLRIPSLKYGS